LAAIPLGQEQSLALAVFGKERDPGPHRCGGGMEVNVLQRLAQPDFTAIGAVGTKDQPQQLGAPAPISRRSPGFRPPAPQ